MPLHVRTAPRSGSPPADALDVTCHPVFAPEGCYPFPPGRTPLERTWREEVIDRMQAHHRVNGEWWSDLLAHPSVTLTCSCTRPDRCVRGILAEVLVQLGAELARPGA